METNKNTKEVKTVIVVTSEGKSATRDVRDRWWKGLTITQIADTTKEAVEGIT